MEDSNYRVAYLVTHPIQYQVPLLRYITNHSDISLTTFFMSDLSVRGYHDAGFNTTVQWDVPLLGGYKHVVLPALGSTQRLSAFQPFVYGLAKHLREGRFDALWLHGYAHQASLRALVIAKSMGIKVFLRTDSRLNNNPIGPLKGWFKRQALGQVCRSVDAVLASGTLNREYYCSYGVPRERTFLLPFAVDNTFFQDRVAQARPQREVLRASLGLEPGRSVILYAAKMNGGKRQADLLAAYQRLSPDGIREPEPYLLYAGDGEDRPALEAQANALGWSSIRFLGFQNQTQMPPLCDLCDVFAMPANAEAWGLVINEVMNAGKPVITTDQCGCAPDLIREGENGFVIRVGDVEALADRLKQILLNPERAERMGAASLEIINRWSFREDLKGLQQALDSTVGRRAATKRFASRSKGLSPHEGCSDDAR